jgi:hypothetical protein
VKRPEIAVEPARRRKIPVNGVAFALRGNYYSVSELAACYHWAIERVQAAIDLLHAKRQVHILRYRRKPPDMTLEPVFKWGEGVDLPCPRSRKPAPASPAPSVSMPAARLGVWGM